MFSRKLGLNSDLEGFLQVTLLYKVQMTSILNKIVQYIIQMYASLIWTKLARKLSIYLSVHVFINVVPISKFYLVCIFHTTLAVLICSTFGIDILAYMYYPTTASRTYFQMGLFFALCIFQGM